MAYDIIFGKTDRSWSCGGRPTSASPEGIVTQAQVDDLAEKTRSEIVKTTNLAIKLGQSKRLPDAEKEPFKRFHKKWMSFSEARKSRYRIEDALSLWNFRKLNERFKSRFDVFAKVATTPIRKPAEPAGTTDLTKVSPWSWGLPLCTGIALAGMTLLARKYDQPTRRAS
jgi:hypothetical protein